MKFKDITAEQMKGHLRAEGCKAYMTIPGLRTKWFWIDEQNMLCGGVYTFFNKQSFLKYKESDLFKSMWQAPMIDSESIKIEVHENLVGGEQTHEMAKWPVSGDRMPVVEADMNDAWLLYVKFRFDFTTNPDIPNADAMRKMMAGGGTAYWKDIPGLRTKDFTFMPDNNNAGYGFYIFTNRADLDTYMKSETFGMMNVIPHIVDLQEPRVLKIVQGSQWTAELGKFANAK